MNTYRAGNLPILIRAVPLRSVIAIHKESWPLATVLLQPDLVVMLAINIIDPAFWYNLLPRKTTAITNHLANAKKVMRRNT
jgi:hypothetical protein